MSNLLPAPEAAKQLERHAHDFLSAAQAMVKATEGGKLPDRLMQKLWKEAYSQLAAAQWELETVLRGDE